MTSFLFVLLSGQAWALSSCQIIANSESCKAGYSELLLASGGQFECVDDRIMDNISEFAGKFGDELTACWKQTTGSTQFTDHLQAAIQEQKTGDPAPTTDMLCCPQDTRPIRYNLRLGVTKAFVCCPTSFTWSVKFNWYDLNSQINLDRTSFNVSKGFRWDSSGDPKCLDSNNVEVSAVGDYDPRDSANWIPKEFYQDGKDPATAQYNCGVSGNGLLRCAASGPISTVGYSIEDYDPVTNSTTFPSTCLSATPGPKIDCFDQDESIVVSTGVRSGDTYVCQNGDWIPKSAIDNHTVQCEKIKDPKDKASCEACLGNNSPTDTRFVYSSLGCIDTSQNGLITRIFQIGIGVIGGVMIIRIIQAVFLMQTGDQQKIEEAREVVSSGVVALIVLLGAVVILRILGINILQILPGNFLS